MYSIVEVAGVRKLFNHAFKLYNLFYNNIAKVYYIRLYTYYLYIIYPNRLYLYTYFSFFSL